MMQPQKEELRNRFEKIYTMLNQANQPWDAVFLVDKFSQFYLMDTMQNGIIVIKSDGTYGYFVRNSYELARAQSPLDNIYPMASYKDLLEFIPPACQTVYLETKTITYEILERLKKYVPFSKVLAIDGILAKARAVKSPYELTCMAQSGKQHQQLLEEIVPGLLKESMSEPELTAKIYERMVGLGYQGVTRFAMFQTEMIIGQLGFGDSSIQPICFDGPGGNRGTCHAVPSLGSPDRKLQKGDLVFVDIGYGVNGYHTDRTQLYMFGRAPSATEQRIHRACVDIQKKTAARLKPGAIPSEIYSAIMQEVDLSLLSNFMGFGAARVSFLGHGIGLHVDEYPVIANGFFEPLEENMTIAIEPKNGVAGVGLLGGEDTYVVTKDGGRCITGGEKDIIVI